MKKYEYRICKISIAGYKDVEYNDPEYKECVVEVNRKYQKPLPVDKYIHKAGAEGWELVMFRTSEREGEFMYLKRVVDED